MKNCANLYMVKEIDKLAKLMVTLSKQGANIDTVLYYKEAAELIKALLKFDGVNIVNGCGINIESPEYDGYENEFFVSIDACGIIGCEKAYRVNDDGDGKYISGFDEYLIVDVESDYPNELIKEYETPILVVFEADFSEEDDCKEDNCEDDDCEDDLSLITTETVLLENENGELVGCVYDVTGDDYNTHIYIETTDSELLKDYMSVLGIESDE